MQETVYKTKKKCSLFIAPLVTDLYCQSYLFLSLSLRLMGLSQTSVLAFVIDTTGSMFDDIEEAKRVSFSIIDSKRGTPEEPSEYILVPFNDPGSHIVYLDHIYPFFPPFNIL